MKPACKSEAKMTDKVKHFLITAACIICGLSAILLFSCATIPIVSTPAPKPPKLSYTTDSEITPYQLFKWLVVFRTSPNEVGIYYIVSANPLLHLPIDCPIKYILCLVDNTKQRLISYAYYLDGQLELYELRATDETLDSGHFTRVIISEHKRDVIDYYLLKFLDMDRT